MISSDAIPLANYLSEVVYVENDVIIEMHDTGKSLFFDLNLERI